MTATQTGDWFPVASSHELPFRHVMQSQLLGQEFAIWRADDGAVNIWENRCLHRGVRLSIGVNDGAELKCQYHGWRYANRSAACTYIPAHPANAPARTITNRTFAMVEAGGLVWTSLSGGPFSDPLAGQSGRPLRAIPVEARPEAVRAALQKASLASSLSDIGAGGLRLALSGAEGHGLILFVQPVDAGRAVIRGLLTGAEGRDLSPLRLINRQLERLRARIEAEALREPAPAPIPPRYEPVPVELASMPEIAPAAGGAMTVALRRKWAEANGVTGLELAPVTGDLPGFQPGAHIDLHLPNGLRRQYSLTNGPGDWKSWTIGVKREDAGRGGSAFIADTLREGDLLAVSGPHNNFPLRRDATETVLIAGGIGLTPILSMARALAHMSLPFRLHVFARSRAHLPFGDALDGFGKRVTLHLGLSAEETGAAIGAALGPHGFARHAYGCGPGPMLTALRETAARQGWPDDAVHIEFFANDRELDQSSSFTIELARSALTLEVPAGRSILDVLRDAGVETPSSCGQGACGTCLTAVLEGTPDHQDVWLNPTERASNRCIMTCVSRALTSRLVLDI